MKQLVDWLVYLVVRLFVCLVQTLSLETCQAIARLLAWLACDVLRLRQHVVDDNLRHVFPDCRTASAANWPGRCGSICS